MALFSTMDYQVEGEETFISFKTLRDLCLESVGKNLNSISRLGRYLLTEHKQTLIKRLSDHDKFTPEFAPHVTYNLFSPHISKFEFSYSEQITDKILKHIKDCGCQLEWLVIEKCPNVTGICFTFSIIDI